MNRPFGLFLFLAAARAFSQTTPIETAWIRSAHQNTAIDAIAPEVHAVAVDVDSVRVYSAGISLQSFGILAARPVNTEAEAIQRFAYRFPRIPQRDSHAMEEPAGITGAFVNGLPIYAASTAASYHDQNLWHVDTAAMADDGTLTVMGRSSPNKHVTVAPALLRALLDRNQAHSPLIGFALDGYPIYGPYGWDASGRVCRWRSSYQLRAITRRESLPDGLRLTPAQDGPAVDATYPIGTFIEDYEYVGGLGDLDEHNGRFAVTPEYPEGTYAYFLATSEDGRLSYPYLLGPRLAGTYQLPSVETYLGNSSGLCLRATAKSPTAGQAVEWLFETPAILERVHERPMHVLIVSSDLAEMQHVHPEAITRRQLRLRFTFAHGGTYWLYADFTPAGGAQTIAKFSIKVSGEAKKAAILRASTAPVETSGIRAALTFSQKVETGRDLTLHFDLTDSASNQPVSDLQPYLGAWGHIMIVSEDGKEFIHAHPKETLPLADANPWQHTHVNIGPSPAEIETTTGFRNPGLYKLWLQVQRSGQVLTFPFTLAVGGPGAPYPTPPPAPDGNAITVTVTAEGFQPARITAPYGQPIRLAFRRNDAQNCASRVVFPGLGIEKELPVGATTYVDLPAATDSEIRFACGMGMLRGAIVVVRKME